MGVRHLLLAGPAVASLDDFIDRGGGEAILLARRLVPSGLLDELELSLVCAAAAAPGSQPA